MSTNPTKRIEEIDRRLEELPKGTLTYKNSRISSERLTGNQ